MKFSIDQRQTQPNPYRVNRGRLLLPTFALAVAMSVSSCDSGVDEYSIQTDSMYSGEAFANPRTTETLTRDLNLSDTTRKDATTDTDSGELSSKDSEILKDIPISKIVRVRFIDVNPEGDSLLEQQGWIDPYEKIIEGPNDELSPDTYEEVLEITTNAGMYDGEGNLIFFGDELGLDHEGKPVGYNDSGEVVPFASIVPYHTYSSNAQWYPNDINLLQPGSKLEVLTEFGLIATFRLNENRELNKVGQDAVWEGFEDTLTGVDIATVGCLLEVEADGSYSPTEQVKVGRFEFAETRLVEQ